MARIDGLPSLEIIKGFKGILDFVAWRGIFYVRSWPRTSRADLTQPTLAAASLFGQIVKAYSLLAGPVIAFYQQDAADQPRTARDLHVQAVLGHLHFHSIPPVPPIVSARARAYHSIDQAIPNSAWTPISLNSERFDTDNIHDLALNNHRLTCRTAGAYQISLALSFQHSPIGQRGVAIWLNGVTRVAEHFFQASADLGHVIAFSTLYELALNEWLEIQVYQNTGAALNCLSNANYSPEFMMVRIE